MQANTECPSENDPTTPATLHEVELSGCLPQHIVEVIARLNRLDQQEETIRLCAQSLRATVDAVLEPRRRGTH